jgi:uncharacterized phage protein (TIGR01671 family)
MKREIKFRAKIKAKDFRVKLAMAGKPKNEGEWTYGEVHLQSTIPHIHEGMDKYPIDVDTVGQYTGLKDKNGKEIYEGDIVKAPYLDPIFGDVVNNMFVNIVVGYNKGSFVLEYNGNLRVYISDLYDNIEIIGNIYDNPELLQKEKEI